MVAGGIVGIASALAAHQRATAWQPDAVVAISSPPRRPLPVVDGEPAPWPRLSLRFHDIETAAAGHRRGPMLSHVETFLAFLAEHQPGRLLIHCRAGLSRSPAFAVIAMLEAGTSVDLALDMLKVAMPDAQPNRRILALAGERYGVPVADMAAGLFSYQRAPWGAVGAMLPDIVTLRTETATAPVGALDGNRNREGMTHTPG